MANKLMLDGNKLIYHLPRLLDWKNGNLVFPILVEISPVGYCNQKCIFCAYNYLKSQNTVLEKNRLIEVLGELAQLGVKSIFFSGEGEPLLHPSLSDFIEHAKRLGLDCALNTNGILLTPDKSEAILGSLSWVRFSVNAGSEESYQKIHNAKPGSFETLLNNLKAAVKTKKANNYDVILGVQLVYIGQPFDEIQDLALELKKIGINYFTIKPFNKHPLIKFEPENKLVPYEKLSKIENLSDDSFYATVRDLFLPKAQERRYNYCYGLDFFAELQSDGNFCPCGPLLGIKEYNYGNIYEQSFKEIWQGKLRLEVLDKIKTNIKISNCMANCRLNSVNNLLWQIKNEPIHINFI